MPPTKVPRLLRKSLSPRKAAVIIATFTLLVTVAGGILIRVFDGEEYPTIGKGLWFALQTVTTVGYGDVTPEQSSGRVIATVMMLAGIGVLAVITASVTAALVESARRRFALETQDDVSVQLQDLSERLARIEEALDRPPPPRSRDGVT